MQEHDGITRAHLDVGHFPPQGVHALLLARECCTHHDTLRPFFSEGFLSLCLTMRKLHMFLSVVCSARCAFCGRGERLRERLHSQQEAKAEQRDYANREHEGMQRAATIP